MKINLEMAAEEKGSVTIRNCDCAPRGSYKSQGEAVLRREGTGVVTCDCGKSYDCDWSATQSPRKETTRVNIFPTREDDSNVSFDNYISQGGTR